MKSFLVSQNEAGQRLDKLLSKYMDTAPKSFFYKMLRKKNITLNGKKAEGSEKVAEGDEIRLFLSDETIEGFQSEKRRGNSAGFENGNPNSSTLVECMPTKQEIPLWSHPIKKDGFHPLLPLSPSPLPSFRSK